MKLVGGRQERERSVLMVLRRGYLEEGTGTWMPTRLVISATRMPRGSPPGTKIWMVLGVAGHAAFFSAAEVA